MLRCCDVVFVVFVVYVVIVCGMVCCIMIGYVACCISCFVCYGMLFSFVMLCSAHVVCECWHFVWVVLRCCGLLASAPFSVSFVLCLYVCWLCWVVCRCFVLCCCFCVGGVVYCWLIML